jgi:hypothetical protein
MPLWVISKDATKIQEKAVTFFLPSGIIDNRGVLIDKVLPQKNTTKRDAATEKCIILRERDA